MQIRSFFKLTLAYENKSDMKKISFRLHKMLSIYAVVCLAEQNWSTTEFFQLAANS